jgi:hypothetical protein
MTAKITPRSGVRGRPRTTGAFTCDRCSRAAVSTVPAGRKAGSAGPASRSPCAPTAPAPAAGQSACSQAGLLPTITSQSAAIAPASPRTTTAPAAGRKPSTTARTPAPAAHSGPTSRRCCTSTSPRARTPVWRIQVRKRDPAQSRGAGQGTQQPTGGAPAQPAHPQQPTARAGSLPRAL